MPYIKKEDRKRYDEVLSKLPNIITKGELEYCITKLQHNFMKTRVWGYSNLHDCIYATMHCADEFRRRYLDDHEDVARELNGDVRW